MSELSKLVAGQQIVYGGNRVAVVSDDLAEAFTAGDRLVIVQSDGALLHVPAAEAQRAVDTVTAAVDGFHALAACTDEQISQFFEAFATRLADDDCFAPIAAANEADVSAAAARGRSTTRLVLSATMRADMISGLRVWRDLDIGRDTQIAVTDHGSWSVEQWRSPLGVVGFVFEGRPNVFADATGVLRTGNTAVFRIGSDALRTARAIMEQCVRPALAASGLPVGAVQLLDSAAHAAGWALFSDARLALAVARGSGPAVAQLGAVARQAGVPVSLHGTGGAWMIVGDDADPEVLASAVEHSLDRKVCNTMNVCVLVGGAARLESVVVAAAQRAAQRRGTNAVVHDTFAHPSELGHEFEWETAPEFWLARVATIDEAIDWFNCYSPRFAASLVTNSAAAANSFFSAVDAPFVGNGMTRWVDGQFALSRPELGLSNWQHGRLLGRGGVLSGDSVHTIRLRAVIADHSLRR